MTDNHDLVIRLITKYLYRENPTLANLHLINRRYYSLRKIFRKQLTYVSISFIELIGINKRFRYTDFFFISKAMQYKYNVSGAHSYTRSNWVDVQTDLLRQANDTSHNYLKQSYPLEWCVNLSRKLFVKQLIECLSLIIKKYDDGEWP